VLNLQLEQWISEDQRLSTSTRQVKASHSLDTIRASL
jgi:hypothetical protein